MFFSAKFDLQSQSLLLGEYTAKYSTQSNAALRGMTRLMSALGCPLLFLNVGGFWPLLAGIGHYTPRTAEWMTLRQVAAYLSIPASTVYKLKARGALRGYKIGRSLRFDRSEVDADVKRTKLHASSRKTRKR